MELLPTPGGPHRKTGRLAAINDFRASVMADAFMEEDPLLRGGWTDIFGRGLAELRKLRN
jgi:hypothetical protein